MGAEQSRQNSSPGFAPHRGPPPWLPGSGEGPQAWGKPGSQLEARRLPRASGEGQEEDCASKPDLGCRKKPTGPSPHGESLGQMENHKACKDSVSLLWVKLLL